MFLLLLTSQWAVTESWTQDLFLTKEVLYHWAITALYRAENGAQTRDPQLGRLVLYQLSYFRKNNFSWEWEVMDSNHRSRKTTDLQSAPFGRSGNLPIFCAPTFVSSDTFLELSPILEFYISIDFRLSLSSILNIFEPLVGFEPTTPRLQITCSGQLS